MNILDDKGGMGNSATRHRSMFTKPSSVRKSQRCA